MSELDMMRGAIDEIDNQIVHCLSAAWQLPVR